MCAACKCTNHAVITRECDGLYANVTHIHAIRHVSNLMYAHGLMHAVLVCTRSMPKPAIISIIIIVLHPSTAEAAQRWNLQKSLVLNLKNHVNLHGAPDMASGETYDCRHAGQTLTVIT